MMRRLKHFLGVIAFWSGLYRLFLRNKAVVALFHRVDDRLAGNPISCTEAEFETYCAFFARYFTVVPLGELVEKLERGENISAHLVITFDDGYKDNYATAAPVLARAGLPACFFIATEFVGSNRVPWWDAERGITPEWMTWGDVRALIGQGFEIGAHTRNHVDLGVISGADASEEIGGSGARLRAETGRAVPWFSYPYGGRHQLTEANRDTVRRAGYSGCLSAYGGVVTPRTPTFAIQRTPVSPWYVSPYHFGFEVMRERDGHVAPAAHAEALRAG